MGSVDEGQTSGVNMPFEDGSLVGDGRDVGMGVEGIHKERRVPCDAVVDTPAGQETYVGPDRETYTAWHIHKVAGGGSWKVLVEGLSRSALWLADRVFQRPCLSIRSFCTVSHVRKSSCNARRKPLVSLQIARRVKTLGRTLRTPLGIEALVNFD